LRGLAIGRLRSLRLRRPKELGYKQRKQAIVSLSAVKVKSFGLLNNGISVSMHMVISLVHYLWKAAS
jgi:hypothetical protein